MSPQLETMTQLRAAQQDACGRQREAGRRRAWSGRGAHRPTDGGVAWPFLFGDLPKLIVTLGLGFLSPSEHASPIDYANC